MLINYICNQQGQPEYVVIPVHIWEMLKQHLPEGAEIGITQPAEPKEQEPFNPEDYKGMLSHLDIDVDEETKKMRDEWKRDF